MEAFASFLVFALALLAFLATGIPVAVATGLIGLIGTYLFVSPFAVAHIATVAFSTSSYFILTVVPLFIMMGEALAVTGIGRDLFRAAQLWLYRIPGSLAVGTIFACTGFSSVCGSSPVTSATIGAMAVPEMVRHGYDRRLALGVTAAGGTLGILIPPSIAMILYGVITETSIGDLFIAGLLPGILIAGLLSLTVVALVLARPGLAPRVAVRAPACRTAPVPQGRVPCPRTLLHGPGVHLLRRGHAHGGRRRGSGRRVRHRGVLGKARP